MKTILAFFACVLCKGTHGLLRLLGRGGTAFPGRIALRICPELHEICSQGMRILLITGTNGKTTSTKIAEKALRLGGMTVVSNRSGANLADGIACELILNTDIFMRPKAKWAVIECDEASCRTMIPKLRPVACLVTNLFRDQLDRYGSVSKTGELIGEGLSASPETVLCYNADGPMTQSLAVRLKNPSLGFGVDCGTEREIKSGEERDCPLCGARLGYARLSYANLGSFACPRCGFKRESPPIRVCDVLSDESFVIDCEGERKIGRVALPGLHNIYNALGVAALMYAAGLDISLALEAAESFSCGFGRMECFPLGKSGARMILIKNAAAADRALRYIYGEKGEKTLVFAINNRVSDGKDLSWLSDCELELLGKMRGLKKVLVCGDRAKEMADCLGEKRISCETLENYDILIKLLKNENSFIFLLPTYTAMLKLRQSLVKSLGGKNFWE